jgi:hypothetical protein
MYYINNERLMWIEFYLSYPAMWFLVTSLIFSSVHVSSEIYDIYFNIKFQLEARRL